MLVLSRKKEEVIRIGDEITIKVISIKGGGVRLGIDAPIDVSIVRSELLPNNGNCEGSSAEPPSVGSPVATSP
ncbi:MAG: carbon storage regulator [Rhodopirellula sp.]|nr:carbon storage regulator [Rhodopirellula sp.]